MKHFKPLLNIVRVIVLSASIALLSYGAPASAQAISEFGDADGDFGQEERSETSAPASGPFVRITPPVSVKSLPLDGKRDKPLDVLEVTNNSGRTIYRLVVRIFLLGKDGSVRDFFPHTNDHWFGEEQRNELGKMNRFTISLNPHHLKPDIVAVAGLPTSVTWEDGTEWPTSNAPAPDQEGDAPVALRLEGIVKEGKFAAPLVEFFNYSNKRIEKLEYQIYYLDEDGNQVHVGTRMRLGSGIVTGKTFAHVGEQGVPNNATNVRLALNFVNFKDGSRWTPED